MEEKKNNMKKPEEVNLSVTSSEDNAVNSNADSFAIPSEAACSHEFTKGCFVMEDEDEKGLAKED